MSGIACIFHTNGQPADPVALRSMTAAIAYRGPDGIDHWHAGAVALGHCQMHTTAESLTERQPLANADQSCVVVMDGYLANAQDLRRDLLQRGAILRDSSDAELVLRAYEQWGDLCPRRIDGEYAFIVWDAARRSVFCARDHQGLRPLLYHWDGRTFIAASDAAALLAVMAGRPPLNLGFLTEYLTGDFYSRDETIWAGVQRLEAAHSMMVNANGPAASRYWSLPLEVSLHFKSDADYAEHYRAVLEDSLLRASRSHKPVACEVSGGLDSSALFGLAAALLRDQRLPAPGLNGYTLAGLSGSDADEVAFARAAADAAGLPVCESPLFMPDLAWFDSCIAASQDLPPVPNSAMSMNLGDALVSDDCRVCLNGLGGDQWLSGSFFDYQQSIGQGQWGHLLNIVQADRAAFGTARMLKLLAHYGLAANLPEGAREVLQRIWRKLSRQAPLQPNDYSWLTSEMQHELAQRQENYAAQLPTTRLKRVKDLRQSNPYSASMFDFNNRQFSRGGFDMRHPMLSRSFAEFSASTSEYYRRRGAINKFGHRRALGDILPRPVLERSSKAGFSITYYHLEAEIGRQVTESLCKDFGMLADATDIRVRFAKYCDATIDSRVTHDLWGIYVANAVLRLLRA